MQLQAALLRMRRNTFEEVKNKSVESVLLESHCIFFTNSFQDKTHWHRLLYIWNIYIRTCPKTRDTTITALDYNFEETMCILIKNSAIKTRTSSYLNKYKVACQISLKYLKNECTQRPRVRLFHNTQTDLFSPDCGPQQRKARATLCQIERSPC